MQALEALNKNNVFGDLGEEANLPDDILPDDQIKELYHEENQCELCDVTFKKVFNPRHHCRRCYKSVCNNCSGSKRRLCKKSEKEYRVCDACDTQLSNHKIEQHQRLILKA